jgi:hypothetical protein
MWDLSRLVCPFYERGAMKNEHCYAIGSTLSSVFTTTAIILCLIAHSLEAAQGDRSKSIFDQSNQWHAMDGRIVAQGQHEFTQSWFSDGSNLGRGMYWTGKFRTPEKERQYVPWETTVRNSVVVKKASVDLEGPGHICVFAKSDRATVQIDYNGSGGIPIKTYTQKKTGNGGWQGQLPSDPRKNILSLQQDKSISLDIFAQMAPYDNRMNTGEFSYYAPQSVQFEVWFFPSPAADETGFTYSSDQTKTDWFRVKDCGLNEPDAFKFSAEDKGVIDAEVQSDGVDPSPTKKPSDIEKIDVVLENIKAQSVNPKLPPERRAELIKSFNELVQAAGDLEAQKIMDDFHLDFWLDAVKVSASYLDVTSKYVTIYDAGKNISEGKWGEAMLGALTLIPPVKILKEAGTVETGTLIQIFTDYYKTATVLKPNASANSPAALGGGAVYTGWGGSNYMHR